MHVTPSDSDDEPEVVTVSGTGATPDVPVPMLAGATGARIPTGVHRRSGAMPDLDRSRASTGTDTLLVALVVVAAVVVLAALAWLASVSFG